MQHPKRLMSIGLTLCLALLALNCGLTEMLQRPPTVEITIPPPTPTDTPEAHPMSAPTSSSSPTATPTPQPTMTVTATPSSATPKEPTSAPPSPTATHTQVPPLAPTDTAPPNPTATTVGLHIDSFEVWLEDTASGKNVHCAWETSGAVGVHIVVGTSQRFPQWREELADGTTTFEVVNTVYNHPLVTLTAFDGEGNEITETRTLDWRCDHTYFFAGSGVDIPDICPYDAPVTRQGAQQSFQGGTMIWIPDIEGRDVIIALSNDGGWYIYNDTWDESQPESDPAISPPTGLQQPIRGFGKVWREHSEVQSQLNWATAGEVAVSVTYQRQMQESIGGVRHIQVGGGALIRLTGLGGSGSAWRVLP